MNSSKIISFRPNSLYIATQTIPTAEDPNSPLEQKAWHWSFFVTDTSGNISQHHWNVGLVHATSEDEGSIGEYYQTGSRQQVRARIDDKLSAYVYFGRVTGWNTPELEEMKEALGSLYYQHEGKPPAILRAMNPLHSCRTWIIAALRMFVAKGWLVRKGLNEEWFVEFEEIVKRESGKATGRFLEIVSDSWMMDPNKFEPTIGVV